jgi:hypothetical protein
MPLIYSAVARGSTLLAEYSVFAGNFGSVAKDYLSKATNAGRFAYTVDSHVFSFLAEDGYSESPCAEACPVSCVLCLMPAVQSAGWQATPAA